MRSHRAFRQLATLLSRKGFTVMRYDHPGTGDSFGNAQDISYSEWKLAAGRVIEELKKKSAVRSIDIVGLRLGGLLAADIALTRSDIDKTILWDPYASGNDFLEDCKNETTGNTNDHDIWWLHGFPLPATFRAEISKVSLLEMKDKKFQMVLSDNADINLLKEEASHFIVHHIPSSANWNFVDIEGSILMPTDLIQKVCSLLVNPGE